ncbi:MAG TPA: hypothetical protein VFE82_11645 [Ramlibacter sp.]|jgi:hypothetical protein|uniref:hypothetical protein n=1 Tax=Ramlibacter sp. TaxID=1917967 RepID=UPI002D278631|nr:hypothetical protein [Ramlibacter sp.]HZY19125.1 hypothetical protein [Ramlibacter sp.]
MMPVRLRLRPHLPILLLACAPALATAQPIAWPSEQPATSEAPAPREEAASERCERLLREFDRSAACYERFRTVNGMRPGAPERCGPPVRDPAGECVRRTGGGSRR